MPGAYPPAPPTLSGDLMTIHRLLASPTLLQRRLRTIRDLKFVSDQILTNRYRTSGGAISYQMSEPITNSRAVEAVPAGSEYPRDSPADGTAAIAAVSKWGQATSLTDEKLKRSVYMGAEVNRTLQKVSNTVISKIDRLTTTAVASAVTATSAAISAWATEATARMYRDMEVAATKITSLNQGYDVDAALMSDEKYALLISDPVIASMRRRETDVNPIYGGTIERIGKYRIIHTPASNLASDDVWMFDSAELGGMADETEVDPGYANAENGLQVKTKRIDERDAWDLWARRITVPVIQEPAAGIKITGT